MGIQKTLQITLYIKNVTMPLKHLIFKLYYWAASRLIGIKGRFEIVKGPLERVA